MTYNVTFGDSIELNCTINYAPDLKDVTWLRSTIPHVAVDMGDATKYSGSSIVSPHLAIQNVVLADNGFYYCKANNDYQEIVCSPITLSVFAGK